MLRDLVAAAGVDVSDAALLRVYLVCKECAKLGRAQLPAAPPPPDPSFKFEYDDRFLGRLVRVSAAQLHQVDAPLQLMHALSFHFSCALAPRAELRQPSPPLRHTQVALWPAQRARIMPGVTTMTCHRFSTGPASLNVYYRTASGWKALCFSRVMSGHFGRLQVRSSLCKIAQCLFSLTRAAALSGGKRAASSCRTPPPPVLTHPFRVSQAAAAARIVGKADVFTAARNGNTELVKDHVVADAGCVLKADSGCD
jgi:hypothetical protein